MDDNDELCLGGGWALLFWMDDNDELCLGGGWALLFWMDDNDELCLGGVLVSTSTLPCEACLYVCFCACILKKRAFDCGLLLLQSISLL